MSWLHVLVLGASATAAMRAAYERGDLDEVARLGALAGPAVIERALAPVPAGDAARVGARRTMQLAAIAAAPAVEDQAELLAPLARLAASVDPGIALPAANAARTIARSLARHERPDDLAADDLVAWRAAWAELALRRDRATELRVAALDTAAALAVDGIGVDLAAALGDPDPVFRRAVAETVPLPVPVTAHGALAAAVRDPDDDVALAAAQTLCLSLDPARPRPILDAIGDDGLARIRALTGRAARSRTAPPVLRDAARCLVGDAPPRR